MSPTQAPVDTSDRAPRRDTGGAPHHSLVPVAQPALAGRGVAAPGSTAPFLAQLIAAREPSTGERRQRRSPGAIGARASEAYGATGRLSSLIEPGFLVRRQY